MQQPLYPKSLNVLLFGQCDSGKTTLLTALKQLNDKKNNHQEQEENDSDYDEEEMADKFYASNQITSCYFHDNDLDIYFKEYCYKNDLLNECSCFEIKCYLFNAKMGMFETELYQFNPLEFLGLPNQNVKTIFVITNIDNIENQQQRFQEIKSILEKQVIEKFNLKGACTIPVDSKWKQNIYNSKFSWYNGNTLIEELKNFDFHSQTNQFRIKILKAQRENNQNYAICKVLSGNCAVQSSLTLISQLNKQPIQIEFISDLLGNLINYFSTFQMLQIQFEQNTNCTSGDILIASDTHSCYVVQEMIADVELFSLNQQILTISFQGELQFIGGRVKFFVLGIDYVIEKEQKLKKAFLKSNDCGRVRLQLNEKQCVDKFENCSLLGSFLILNTDQYNSQQFSKIIGQGKIIKVKPI